jgi:pyruvate formate lyase activating enzyme
MKKEIRFRIPVIEGVNSDPLNIEATGRFIAETAPQSRVDLLPYHDLATSKYAKLGLNETRHSFRKPQTEALDRSAVKLKEYGLTVIMGG